MCDDLVSVRVDRRAPRQVIFRSAAAPFDRVEAENRVSLTNRRAIGTAKGARGGPRELFEVTFVVRS